MKLKTLEDFEDMQLHDDGSPCLLMLPILKAEAIKWVKGIQKGSLKELKSERAATIWWIKHFFNITEDELK